MTSAAPPRAEKKSNFFLGFLLLPKAKREALSAVYAYCRLIDDIVDTPEMPKDEARRQLDFWREEIERLYRGEPAHDVSRGLLKPVADYNIPKEAFLEMIRGCAMDLDGTRYETIADLESYMRGVASSVGIMCIHIFGWTYTSREAMHEFATVFGYAFQLTNIIRDVGADLEIGRVYLPLSEIKDARYCVDRLVLRDHGPAFDRLMEGQYKRAKAYYARARNLVDFRDRPSLLPAEVMAHVYEGLLDEIKEREFRVLFQKTSLPGYRKLALAFKAWLYCHGL
ncbi:MAG: squalene synthase HpnD [Elusimicrobia bacterium CG11_big_fil_rev_8_21_14_0_20_64_6]|nr:MAG: squalene synthase HpnD [Elusimicrobia bacterium CG11_big_fil_rev_8_21_14_0_20_64_6]